ncbi:helix-turn-helix domain-containing protein [Morganella morganii subsp. morganii]|uniref:helix-turn-helix domain-containing protein n=1 Tax=Morganella morganii TaxID=582 RepID=UPI001BDA21A2|nr:helix-turn-helix domain-containing protein [Morganella morganii]ELB1110577.1 helix-turn-helix domain-containing protein [Morganella morganii]MBT0311416.1 helix-turn-helix domain-containing protein [Morganella morganii subsp. morganii]HCR3555923.1 helix-turn-helix domain-containing protein [Morganella morganii]HCR3760860.1 helix-turn-helix domain-containing protein [Morganella morganii]
MHGDLIDSVLDWVEDNINMPISQTDVVKKSGYSQRYFQDIFLEKTKLSIAKYILARKLSLSSVLLRLTNLSVFEISTIYSFNSQQSFSRAFKRYFRVTPNLFRKREFWDFRYYFPQHRFLNFKDIEHKPVSLCSVYYTDDEFSKIKSFDITIPFEFKSNYSVEGLAFKNKNQINHIKTLIKESNSFLSVAYDFYADEKTKNKIKVKYIIKQGQSENIIFNEKGSKYYMFSFVGSWSEYVILSNVIYTRELPRLNLKRRLGFDIEMFYSSGHHNDDICSLYYFIPVC